MKWIKVLGFLVILLVVVNLVATNRLVGQGQTINELTQEISKVEHSNRKLKLSIARKGALIDTNSEITKLGFKDPENIATLRAPSHVAQIQE